MHKLFIILMLLSEISLKAQQDTSAAHLLPDSLRLQETLHQIDSLRQQKDSTSITDSIAEDIVIGNFILKKSVKPVVGTASYYSRNLDGSKTSTGEIYRNSKLTGASNDFKMHSWVKVTNLRNHRSVIIRINDRMHPRMARRGRVVDLSRAAAIKLDFMKSGLAKVKMELLVRKIVD